MEPGQDSVRHSQCIFCFCRMGTEWTELFLMEPFLVSTDSFREEWLLEMGLLCPVHFDGINRQTGSPSPLVLPVPRNVYSHCDGNLDLIILILLNSHLYTPMYFFLFNLSFIELCFFFCVTPKCWLTYQKKNIYFLHGVHDSAVLFLFLFLFVL